MQHQHAARAAVMAAATLTAALVAGCPKPAKDATLAEGGATAPLATQAELARSFPAEPTVYRCFDHDISTIKQMDGVVHDELEPTVRETTFAIDENTVTEIDASGSRREYHLTKFDYADHTGYSLGPTYLDCEVECRETIQTHNATNERPAVVLLDDLVYVFASFNVTEGSMWFNYVCALGEDEAKLRSVNADGHRQKLFDYNSDRERTARTAWHAEGEELRAAADARQRAGWQAESEADALARKIEQEERLARARNNIVSIAATASGNSPTDSVWIAVTARLADGTSMVIDTDESIFRELFGTEMYLGDYTMNVEVYAKDDDSIRVETGMIAFTFADEHRFGCQGDPGANGTDTDWQGAMNFTGRRGGDGPTLTVEIGDTGVRTSNGAQLLRYRLSCDGRTEVFTASASAYVGVATTGGKGGYGVARSHGSTTAGSDGGDGGDGGMINVIVDPSVETYTLNASSSGGEGGNGSQETDAALAGSAGNPGNEGPVSVETAPVEIP